MGVILRVIYCGHSRLLVMNDGVILRVIYCGHIIYLMDDGVILRVIYLMNDGLILRVIYCGHSRLSEMNDGAIFSVIYCGHIRLLFTTYFFFPGWHRRINGFYVLAETHALTRVHRKIFKEVHGRLFEIWEKYEDDDMTTTQLLRACSHINELGPSTTQDDIHDEDF
ncbi:hypothetical protein DPMN_145907 [Dreissena polymorpha]|uniref:Uncharacterized protein n=1 Tax=Dreissena polymorpha TaxID=45954 RepID=A0A9D4IXY9_DREPO|nr:hypothetical protein DPMN_145907 [Dreissena polymorpha]